MKQPPTEDGINYLKKCLKFLIDSKYHTNILENVIPTYPKQQIYKLILQAHTLFDKTKFDESKKVIETIFEIFDQINEKDIDFNILQIKAQSFGLLGSIHKEKGQFDKAKKNYSIAIQFCKCIVDKQGCGVLINNFAKILEKEKKYTDAISIYECSLELFKKIKDDIAFVGIMFNIGAVNKILKKYIKSLDNFNQCLELFKKMDDVHGEMITLFEIGQVYRLMKKYDDAIFYFLKITSNLKPKEKIQVTMTEVNSEGKNKINISTIKEEEKIPKKYLIMKSYIEIAKVFKEKNNIILALKYLNDAFILSRKYFEEKTGNILTEIGHCHFQNKKYDIALKYYTGSLKFFSKKNDTMKLGESLENIGVVYEKMAKKCFEEAVKLKSNLYLIKV